MRVLLWQQSQFSRKNLFNLGAKKSATEFGSVTPRKRIEITLITMLFLKSELSLPVSDFKNFFIQIKKKRKSETS